MTAIVSTSRSIYQPQTVPRHVSAASAGEVAHAIHQRIVALRGKIEALYLDLGRELVDMEMGRKYRALGHETFESYIADPDVTIGRTTAYRVMAIWRTLGPRIDGSDRGESTGVLRRDMAGVGVMRAELLTRVITAETPAERVRDWIASARTLSVSDLETEVRQVTNPPAPTCPDAVIDACRRIERIARRVPLLADGEEIDRELMAIKNTTEAALITLRRLRSAGTIDA